MKVNELESGNIYLFNPYTLRYLLCIKCKDRIKTISIAKQALKMGKEYTLNVISQHYTIDEDTVKAVEELIKVIGGYNGK